MLAPRKKLWSTPSSAVGIALDFADLDADDIVYDVGCGDGRVLIQMAAMSLPLPVSSFIVPGVSTEPGENARGECHDRCPRGDLSSIKKSTASRTGTRDSKPRYRHHYCRRFVGIEISLERVAEAHDNIRRARRTNRIPSHVSIEIVCANALDTSVVDYSKATVIFLYLVPRGLRLIKSVLWPEGGGNDMSMDGSQQKLGLEYQEDLAAKASSNQTNDDIVHLTTVTMAPNSMKRSRRIITYMAPFENVLHARKEHCVVNHQEGAAWPMYLYHA